MKIEVNRVNQNQFEIVIEDRLLEVDGDGLARPNHEIGDLFDSGARIARSERYDRFRERLQSANNTSFQALLGAAAHNNILVLLHSSEKYSELHKIFLAI